jgi:ankyrin repeat protein
MLLSVLNDWLKDLDSEGLFTKLTVDFESDLALHSAYYIGEEALLKLMLNAGARHLATEKGHEAVVKLLLEKGANIDGEDFEYRSPLLWWAALEGHEAVVKLLLEIGANVDAEDFDCTEWARGSGEAAAGERR